MFQDLKYLRGLDNALKLQQMSDKKQAAGHKLTALMSC